MDGSAYALVGLNEAIAADVPTLAVSGSRPQNPIHKSQRQSQGKKTKGLSKGLM